jgi:phage gp29-like protein
MSKTAKKGSGRTTARKPLAAAPAATMSVADAYAAFGTGKTDATMVRRSNLWRDNYNPLRGLGMARLIPILEAAERGAFAELQLLLRKTEKRYPVLKGFVERLLCSVEELGWDVKVLKTLPPGATPAMAEKQRAFLKQRYDLVGNLNEAIGQIALAEVRGYSVLQKHRFEDGENGGRVSELYWIEPWVWCRDGFYGDFYYNEISRFGVGLGACAGTFGENCRIGSDQLPREDFVIREVESPLYEIALIAFVNWLMGRKDWAAFVEIFGLAKGVVIMPPNIAIGKEQDYQTAAEKVSDGVSGALPAGSDIKFPAAGVRGEHPFEKYCEAQNQDVVMAATSGLLSMLTAGPGSTGGLNRGPNQEHQDIWVKIARMKGKRVNETLNKDFDLPELAAAFPGQPICAYFNIPTEDEEDIGSLADTVVKFEGVNLQTDVKEISDRTGMKLTRVKNQTDPALGGGPGASPAAKADDKLDKGDLNAAVKNRASTHDSGLKTEDFYAAVADDLQHLRDRVSACDAISDPDLRARKFQALLDDWDQMVKDITADPETARALEQINQAALAAGLNKETMKP